LAKFAVKTFLEWIHKELELSFKRDMKDLEVRLTVRLGAMIAAGIVIVASLVSLL